MLSESENPTMNAEIDSLLHSVSQQTINGLPLCAANCSGNTSRNKTQHPPLRNLQCGGDENLMWCLLQCGFSAQYSWNIKEDSMTVHESWGRFQKSKGTQFRSLRLSTCTTVGERSPGHSKHTIVGKLSGITSWSISSVTGKSSPLLYKSKCIDALIEKL